MTSLSKQTLDAQLTLNACLLSETIDDEHFAFAVGLDVEPVGCDVAGELTRILSIFQLTFVD
jgi:hypothetical protein